MSTFNPCVTCGACCASFRVSFYWAEGDDAPAGFVPHELTEQVNSFYRCMQGTNSPTPRCVALSGTIGESVGCSIYGDRPTPCREFDASLDGSNPRCDQARAKFGMLPLIQIKEVA
ncbi:YkgJ family cysteine cluster protein [Aliidiomarina halalkaliphila]|uniref:YkgJ family cysteine cluster protein n=1 Tax=Aliidiomarina halalkaliphila TaxID=2593535 RepID=A0A552X0A8_9GAMM|nr:YkgJ family cysteine cluster protein [Aliidiomarina halalkaliphila]TRW48487.1 YkgJ family cysteine cluster protein [Aliidiomarina halalkaliphila]